MHYDGLIYRPPFEATSLLLQVTVGCSHNRCTFCTMYRDVPFRVSPLSEVEEDLKEASEYKNVIKRVFLEGGDAFALSGEKLIQIAEMIHEYVPNVKTIASYASINNIRGKSDEELVRLHELGIDELNIGLESGDDEALAYMNKGFTAGEALTQLLRLKKAGIRYGLNVILGLCGNEGMERNALKTAELVNKTDPYLIFIGTLHADKGCPLYDAIRDGSFKECTVRQYIEEEKLFIKNLKVTNCTFFALHPSNIVRFRGKLPQDKNGILYYIHECVSEIPEEKLDKVPMRSGEGGVML